jgi:dihydrofolate reductase
MVTSAISRHEGDILVAGSAQLVQSLLADGLVDELRLMVFPVVLGAGKCLFKDSADQAAFSLTETRQAGSVAILVLQRNKD